MKVLIVGCRGQIGSALWRRLKDVYHPNKIDIIGADVQRSMGQEGQYYRQVNATNYIRIKELIQEFQPRWVFHLPAILSAAAEQDLKMSHRAFKVNVTSFYNMLRLAQVHRFRLFCPSSIAVFGPLPSNKKNHQWTDETPLQPQYLYGITKHFNEQLGIYFHRRYGVDYRSIRLPGVLAAESSTGTGTTDYAIAMIKAAISSINGSSGHYECHLRPDTTLPMVYIKDCMDGIIKLMKTPRSALTRCVYNINSLSFDPQSLHKAIEEVTGVRLMVRYKKALDRRQAIADTWPHSLNDRNARLDWKWDPQYDLHQSIQVILTDSIK